MRVRALPVFVPELTQLAGGEEGGDGEEEGGAQGGNQYFFTYRWEGEHVKTVCGEMRGEAGVESSCGGGARRRPRVYLGSDGTLWLRVRSRREGDTGHHAAAAFAQE